MKKTLLSILPVLMTVMPALAADLTSAFIFKYNMHKIYDNFKHARISLTLRRYDIADLYLKHLIENADNARRHIPDRNRDGTPLDKKRFTSKLDELTEKAGGLREAIRKGQTADLGAPPQEIFNTCLTCHAEVKNEFILKFPQRSALFTEYMHKLREHADLAGIYFYEKGASLNVEENLRLINYYLDLLEDTPPDARPSGEPIDRRELSERVALVRWATTDALKNVMEGKPVSIEKLRRNLNTLCYYCHEPERLG